MLSAITGRLIAELLAGKSSEELGIEALSPGAIEQKGSGAVNIIVNGQRMEIEDRLNRVDKLLKSFDLQVKTVVVELNKHILTREYHETTALREGDRIEIVHFVGGG
ncbi:sulfur carrier protein ThiS [Paenibacillus amylolyticus]|nr:sulfur carrier protein ThiS [Paenibacillus amylolyticus]